MHSQVAIAVLVVGSFALAFVIGTIYRGIDRG